MAPRARRGLRRLLRRGIPLRLLLTAAFVSLLVVAVGVTGGLLIDNGRRGVETVGAELRRDLTGRIHEFVTAYLETPHRVNRLTADLLRRDLLDPGDPPALGRHFFHQLGEFDSVSFAFLATPAGGAAGAGRTAEGVAVVDTTPLDPVRGLVAGPRLEFFAGPDGGRGELHQETPGFDARERPWYRAAVERGGPVWSEVYPFFAEGTLAVAASQPLYGPDGELRAVLGADLALGRIGEFLRGLRIGEHGRTFIVERGGIVEGGGVAGSARVAGPGGLLIATSSRAEAPLAAAGGRLRAVDSAEPLVAETARFLGDFLRGAGDDPRSDGPRQLSYALGGERQLVDAVPLTDPRGLDWLIVSAVPEADFMAEVEAGTRVTLLLCLAALAAALAAAVLVARAVSEPVRRLTRASGAIAGGRLDRRVETAGVAELGDLARSFNRMAARLGRTFGELEARVAARTAELSRAKEAADAANRAKGDFLATVSHELRQPLTAILGYAELLAEGGPRNGPGGGSDVEAGEAARALATIRDNGQHLARLVDDLLDLEAIEAGRLELELAECDLAELLARLHAAVAPRARARGLELTVTAEGRLPRRFTAGRLRLRQVLVNLLTNAVKYTERGRVALTVRRASGAGEAGAGDPERTALCFEVADTGPGIPEHERGRLFDPFTRLGGGDGDGFGLGLAIARRLVERMGGSLALESRLGEGSTFRVELPVADAADWTAGETLWTPPAPASPPQPPRRLEGRVLVADDSRALRELYERVLARWGLAAETVADGRAAVERAAAGGFDALIVDGRMPGFGGLAAVTELRRRGVGTPVVAVTAAASAADRERSLAAGCTAHLTKPVDFRRLHATLAAVLDPAPPGAEAITAAAGEGAGPDSAAAGGSDTAAVEIEVARLAERYVRRLPDRLDGLRSALAAGDWPRLHAAAHRLAGTAGSFGLDEIAALAEALERAGAGSDRAAAGPLIERLEEEAVEARRKAEGAPA